MNLVATIITCPAREAMLRQTLASLAGTDLHLRPLICMDTSRAERRQQRQEENARHALVAALERDPELILFLEDDLDFNPHLRHNLSRWKPWTAGFLGLGSLYNPNIREKVRCHPEHWFQPDPEAVYGSQAFLLTPGCARYCLDHWAEVAGMQDIKISRLARDGGFNLFYHTPSLVQHVGRDSAWGGHFHDAQDFDPAFKAETF
jgi:hypothetical protein